MAFQGKGLAFGKAIGNQPAGIVQKMQVLVTTVTPSRSIVTAKIS